MGFNKRAEDLFVYRSVVKLYWKIRNKSDGGVFVVEACREIWCCVSTSDAGVEKAVEHRHPRNVADSEQPRISTIRPRYIIEGCQQQQSNVTISKEAITLSYTSSHEREQMIRL